MPTIQLVFYWVGTIAFGLVGLFMLVAIIMVFVIKAQISRLARTVDTAVFEARMAIEAAKSRVESIRAGILSNVFGAVLKMMKKD